MISGCAAQRASAWTPPVCALPLAAYSHSPLEAVGRVVGWKAVTGVAERGSCVV